MLKFNMKSKIECRILSCRQAYKDTLNQIKEGQVVDINAFKDVYLHLYIINEILAAFRFKTLLERSNKPCQKNIRYL